MYSEAVEDVLNLNPFKLIKEYSINNKEAFKKDVITLSNEGDSILMTFLKRGFSEDFYIDFLDLITTNGYDFKKDVKFSGTSSRGLNKNEKDLVPEFIQALTITRNDNVLSQFAKKLGPEYFLNLEKDGWFLLELMFDKSLSKTIKVMADFGLDFKEPPSGRKLLMIAEKNPSLVDLYWDVVLKTKNDEQTSLNEEQFKHFITTIERKCNQIRSKKDYLVDEVINQVNDKFDKLSQEQRIMLLEATVPSKDLSVVRAVTKKMGIKSTDQIVQEATLKKRHKIQNKDLLNSIITNPSILAKTIETDIFLDNDWKLSKTTGVKLFSEALRNLSIFPYENSSRHRLAGVSVRDKLTKVYDENALFNTKNENGTNLFDLILEITNESHNGRNNLFGLLNKSYKSYHKSGLKFESITNVDFENIINKNIDDFNRDQIKEINDFLNVSWRKTGNISDTISFKVMKTMVDDKFFIMHPSLLKSPHIYTEDEKIYLFSQIINVIVENSWNIGFLSDKEKYSSQPTNNNSTTEQIFKTLYHQIIDNPNKNILKINLDPKTISEIEGTQFYTELQTLMMKEALSCELGDKKEHTRKMKI